MGLVTALAAAYVMPGVVVEAMVDGQERRYGAEAEDSATVGACDEIGGFGGGWPDGRCGGDGFGVVGAPAGGEGPAATEGDLACGQRRSCSPAAGSRSRRRRR